MTRATGIGSLPGTDVREALRMVRDTLGDGHLPYLPELPARGPGADIIGRVIAPPVEAQVGIVTAFIGAPFFIALVRRRKLAAL